MTIERLLPLYLFSDIQLFTDLTKRSNKYIRIVNKMKLKTDFIYNLNRRKNEMSKDIETSCLYLCLL